MMLRSWVWVVGFAVAGFAVTAQPAGPTDAGHLEAVRTTIDKWVEARQAVTQAAAGWRLDKERLTQSIALIEKEIALLDEQIARAEETASGADKARATLEEENEVLSRASVAVETAIRDLEKRVVALAKALPEPLVERLQVRLRRIPEEAALERLSLSERMQNVVAFLSEVDKFSGSISVFTEVRSGPTGGQRQVRTLYVGISMAFFTDAAGEFGGVGVPTKTGWEWTPKPELAPRVARAVAMYENRIPADFVALPVAVQ